MKEEIERSAVAGSFTFNAQLADGFTMVFSGYVLQGEDTATINQKMDLARAVVSRQRAFTEIPELEKALDSKRDAIEQFETIVADLSSHDKRTSKQTMDINNAQMNIKNLRRQIEHGEKVIAEMRQKLAA